MGNTLKAGCAALVVDKPVGFFPCHCSRHTGSFLMRQVPTLSIRLGYTPECSDGEFPIETLERARREATAWLLQVAEESPTFRKVVERSE